MVLERPLYRNVERIARREGVSLSLKVRDLIREALELDQGLDLAAVAEKREKTVTREKALTHNEVW